MNIKSTLTGSTETTGGRSENYANEEVYGDLTLLKKGGKTSLFNNRVAFRRQFNSIKK